jgi:PPK2 family polyphosphate:nucleotide phosphotransferase
MTICETEFRTYATAANAVRHHAPEALREPDFEPDLYRELMVEPGTKAILGDIDPNYCGIHSVCERTPPTLRYYARKIDRLQYLMHAENEHSLLIVLQGVDAGGKDGVVRHLVTSMNPAGCRVVAFKQPTAIEYAHDFLWRVHPHSPAKGEVVIFNRSHYEDVLVPRVHQLAPPSTWPRRFGSINEFERLLTVGNNTTILKFFLHISKEEQLARFKLRLEDPTRRWKISEADYQERKCWDEYVVAFEDMLHKTSTWHAPWFVIPANNKSFRDAAVSQIIIRTLEDLDMRLPQPAVDIDHIRREYHEAEAGVKAS